MIVTGYKFRCGRAYFVMILIIVCNGTVTLRRKQQKVKRGMLVCSYSLVWGFFLTCCGHVGALVHPEVPDWSASLNDSCLQNRLSLLSRAFLGGTNFLPKEVCKVRQINIQSWKLCVSRLLPLSHCFYRKIHRESLS